MLGAGRQDTFECLRSDYQAAKVGRFRRRRNGVASSGSAADYHYRSDADYLRIMEYARDMDRNDAIVGQMVDRAVLNIIQNGLTPDPKTGDAALDQAIKDRWYNFAGDARQCSLDGEYVYRDLEKLSLRQMFVDGDDFSLLTDEGPIELVEAHRCRTPTSTQRNVVHGVMLDGRRRRLEYWFTRDDIDPGRAVRLVSQITKVPAFDAEGNRNVLHLRNPKRVTQTRGVSAFAPVFDMMGMHEDLQFSKLVQQQVASCIAILRERSENFKGGSVDPYGPQNVETFDAFKRIVEDLAPGMEIRGLPGEKISGFSPNIPNAEFFQQMRTILQLIGINLGMPLVLLLMDASDTNFSGWRGAMDQARMGFRDMQQHLIDHWECPIYLWKLRQFAREDRAFRAAMEKKSGSTYFNHEWNAPRWPYIQPFQDAQADQLRQRALLASPRRIHGGLAQDWNDTIDETVEDNKYAINAAIEAAVELSKKAGQKVTWREVLFLTDPEMQKVGTPSAAPTLAAPGASPPAGKPDVDPAEPTDGEDPEKPADDEDPETPPKDKNPEAQ
jgi:lambda family phage portal protein